MCNGPLHCLAQVRTDDSQTHIQSFATPSGFGATDLETAYHLDMSLKPTGTIVVIGAYAYSAAETDLAKYRSQYGLPACTSASGCFQHVNQEGNTTPMPKKAPSGDDWTVENALDLDMASAACPTCKLVLVDANDDTSDGLYIANNTAATFSPKAVSNSWGGSEPTSSEASTYEAYFTHSGIGYFASSGDDGYTGSDPSYPATSLHVTSVGGTSLKKSSSASRGYTETAWSDGGSSCSKVFAKPSYQTSTACSKRMSSDVSAVGDPNTGVAVYNAANGGWIEVGGTSASSPFVAGVMTLYGLAGKGPSYSYSNTTKFYDVTSGKNGSCTSALCKAGTGWDAPTGNGTPDGAKL